MDYPLAIFAGRTAMAFVAVASGYYLLYILLGWRERRGALAGRLKPLVEYARVSHPYLASLISLTVIYHVYVMWMTHPLLDQKVMTGISVSAAVSLMANSGWALVFRPRSSYLRRGHRLGMFLLLVVMAFHRYL
ncbi:MAG: hypothetical protein P4N41_19565 [Negativicutes bacterium]|nr:hypothetical protein [Negativicutes bacterium]MDR3591860.1 hypothetical protein [Negativicutes bacterium]